jgi:hypothetical protein
MLWLLPAGLAGAAAVLTVIQVRLTRAGRMYAVPPSDWARADSSPTRWSQLREGRQQGASGEEAGPVKAAGPDLGKAPRQAGGLR